MQESASLWKEREVIFRQFWEVAGSRPARSRHFELCHLGWRRIPERFGRQKVTDRTVGSEEARLRASLRPPP